MGVLLQAGNWYLFRVERIGLQREKQASYVLCVLECAKGPCVGQKIGERFFLSDKSISRLEVAAHRCGAEREVKKLSDVNEKLFFEMAGKKVWARVVEDSWNGRKYLKVDGWNFRAEDDPPEEAAEPVDYAALDAEEVAMDGL